jgi:hypothetical protein
MLRAIFDLMLRLIYIAVLGGIVVASATELVAAHMVLRVKDLEKDIQSLLSKARRGYKVQS